MLKPSRYVIMEKNNNGELLMLNLLRSQYLKFSPLHADKIIETMKMTSIDDAISTDEYVKKLYENKFLIDFDFDESLLVEAMHEQHVYSNDWLYLTILPTNNCNFRCVYCYETPAEETMNDQTEKNILDFCRKNIKKYKKVRLNWFGGEPLLYKERVLRMTKEIDEICKENKVPLIGMITTNGYNLDLETFKSLIAHRVLSYQVCIDGAETTHNVQRPHCVNKDSFQRVYSNLVSIKNNVNTFSFKMVIRANMTPFVEKHLDEYLDLLAEDFGNDKRFSVYFQGVRDWGGDRITENKVEILANEESYYRKWYDIASKKGLNSADFIAIGPVTGMCEANLKNGYLIYYDGSVHKCSLASQDDKYKDIDNIGYIADGGNLVIDSEKAVQWIVNRVHNKNCYNCELYPICCSGSCPFFKKYKTFSGMPSDKRNDKSTFEMFGLQR